MEAQPLASEAIDPDGARVVLKDEVWSEKIVRDHPEIAEHRADVLRAVSAPDHVAADPIFEQLVVVSYEQTPARIVSAFANRKDPKSWSA